MVYKLIRDKAPHLSVFIEPSLMYYKGGGPRFRPDILVCDSEEITTICEIKFAPHWYPHYSGDLEKMALLAKEGGGADHELEIDSSNGKFTGRCHRITEATKFVFMVIGQSEARAVSRDSMTQVLEKHALGDRFTLLFGRINGSTPEFGVE